MTFVKIISGTYGYRTGDRRYVLPVRAGDPAIAVRDEEAERLVRLGVARVVEDEGDGGPAGRETGEPGTGDREPGEPGTGETETGEGVERTVPLTTLSGDALEDLTVAQLKELAEEMGVDLGGARKKAEMIAVIRDARGAAEDDGEEPPAPRVNY